MESGSSDSRSRRYAPFVHPVSRDRTNFIPQGAADPPAEDDLPLIEQFLDDLPSIEDYLEQVSAPAAVAPDTGGSRLEQQDSEGWAISAWQSYDWQSLANLGRPAGAHLTPEEAWNPEPLRAAVSADPGPSADDVASALDDIAHRIRSGQLPIDQFRSSPPEAAMAALIAAMLRLRG